MSAGGSQSEAALRKGVLLAIERLLFVVRRAECAVEGEAAAAGRGGGVVDGRRARAPLARARTAGCYTTDPAIQITELEAVVSDCRPDTEPLLHAKL